MVFGTSAQTTGCGCGCGGGQPARSMQEEAELLKGALQENFGEAVKWRYVDVESQEMAEFPEIAGKLAGVRLPLTAINGKPRFQGGLPFGLIAQAIYRLLK